MTTDLEIQLLGGFQLRYRHDSLTQFMSNKVPALFLYLAVTGRPHQRDALAALLWGDMADADAKNNLRQALSNLRKFLDPYLLITRDTVEFNRAAPYRMDSADFLQAIEPCPEQPLEQQIARLQAAATLYQGDFLAGFWVRQAPDFEEWVLTQRSRFRDLALQTLHTLTHYALHSGNYPAAIESASRLLALDSWREEAHYQLMLALARSGQRAAALQQYESCRRLLEQELGVEPSSELTLLASRIRDAQQHRHPPLPTAPFLAREEEWKVARQRLMDPNCRLLTVTGTGGVGKTHLALAVVASLQSAFLNGVYLVSGNGVDADSPDALLFAVIDGLHLMLAGSHNPQRQLFAFLRTKELLLVLDNMEHLLEQCDWLNELLEVAPDLKIVATSRERLNLSGEWVIELDGLPIPPSSALESIESGAGQLFVATAQRVRSGFHVTPANAPHIRRICQLVGGLPLAITLAASWVHAFSCADIAREIAANVDFLTSSRRDIPQRQRSLRAVFDHSWHLLTPREQQQFAALAIFRGTFSREAAHAVTGITMAELVALVEKSLLRRVYQERYELHPLLRQYADQQLGEGERYRLQAHHAAYFARWLAHQEQEGSPSDEADLFKTMSRDHDNLRAYWQWAIQEKQMPLLAQGLNTLRLYYSEQGRYQEGMEWLAKTTAIVAPLAEAAAARHPTRQLWGRLLSRWATFCLWGGQRPRADLLFQAALPLAYEMDEPVELGFALLNKGYLTVLSGDYATAEVEFAESLRYYRRAEDKRGIANALSALGALGNVTGAWEHARAYLEESVAISRELQDENGLRSSLTNLGNVFYEYGDSVRAKAYYLEVLPLCQKVGDRSAEGIILCNLGSLAQREGELAEAESLMKTGLALFRELNSWQHVIHATTSLAGVHVAQGQYEQAQRELRWALQKSIAQELHHMSPLAAYEIGLLYYTTEHHADALELHYWVLNHPASMAEQKLAIEERLPFLESRVGEQQAAALRERAHAITADDILARLTVH